MISIIIPVKNDRKIEETLKNLKLIKKPEKTEILVIDASERNLDDIRKKFPKVRWIYFHNETDKNYTFTEQINMGLKNATGDIICLIDADCIAKKDWLVELIRPIKKENENYVTGIVKSNRRSFHDKVWENLRGNYRNDAGSANTAFTKNLLNKVGYYDERFEAGSDTDFSWRAIDKGFKIRYNSKAIIFDDWGNLKNEIRRGFRYGEARIKLYRKHKQRWKNLFKQHADTIIFPAFILLLPLSIIFPYYPLILIIPLIKNINNQPFRKLIFDLSHGLGVLKELIFPSKYNIKSQK